MSGILMSILSGKGVAPVPVVGSAYGGGFFAGQISTQGTGVADYNLVIGPLASAENAGAQYKIVDTATTGTTSVIDGPTNSANMNNATHPAAQFCEGLTIGGFSDWYMPAKNELEVCYYNLKPGTQNNAASGTNANSVPARGDYTAGTPAQTSATIFRTGNSEAFSLASYWSSTQSGGVYAWSQTFYNGGQTALYKTNSFKVRAVRRVAL
jgi:hypothetical protein